MVVMHETVDSTSTTPLLSKEVSSKVTFVQAIHDKYIDQKVFDNQLILPKDRQISTDITFVGFGKVSTVQKQLKKLVSLDLSGRCIEEAGNLNELGDCLNNVKILNLAENLLSWREIIKIVTTLINLREIILTGNRLNVDEQINNYPSKPIESLQTLTLGRVKLSWTSVIGIISRIWNQVQQIDLWDNSLNSDDLILSRASEDSLTSFVGRISALKLSCNSLSDLSWISSIGPIEYLIELDVSRCKLETINLNRTTINSLKNLQTLNISHNDLTSWENIAQLDSLNNLINLICHENPFFIREKFAKSFTIARIGKLRTLNREEVTNPMRRDSEILYVRKLLPEYRIYKKGEDNEFILNNPRYEQLAEIYGLPEDIEKHVDDKYISVDIIYNNNKVEKKLPRDMRVSNLQMLCKRLFKLKISSTIEIMCCEANSSDSVISYPLDKGAQTLHFYSVKNGQRLLINELN